MSHHLTTIEHLKTARTKLKKGWTQKVFARDISGNVVGQTDAAATCYCLVGALPYDYGQQIHAIRKTIKMDESGSLIEWNDDLARTQEEIVSVIDQTIARLENENQQLQILLAAKAKLQQGWLKGKFAFDINGKQVSTYDDAAISFCLVGSLTAGAKAANILTEHQMIDQELFMSLIATLAAIIKTSAVIGALVSYNDVVGRTQEEVIAVVEQAIQQLETK